MAQTENFLWLSDMSMQDVGMVGGKNASLGEMINNLSKLDVEVPYGFATTATAFKNFMQENQLNEKAEQLLTNCDINNINQLQEIGKQIRTDIIDARFSENFIRDISNAYEQLLKKCGTASSFAVRSSATAEDLPTASFAGQQETFLNVSGIENILTKIKEVFASLFNDRAISYRVHHNFEHMDVSISVCVQQMIRSDKSASGVIFTLDTESGYPGAVYITSSYGLGEAVVSGAVNPDEFYVDKRILRENKDAIIRKLKGSKDIKMVYADGHGGVQEKSVSSEERQDFSINDQDIMSLARMALTIEDHYQRPMDIEWAKDGLNKKLYILQARPETVESNKNAHLTIEKYALIGNGELITTGRSVGSKIGKGAAKILHGSVDMQDFQEGDILVTDMTDPDWEPIMKKASAIVTNRGGRTCHAAIIARELGIPAVVGTEDATKLIEDGEYITVSCAEGDEGKIYLGDLKVAVKRHQLNDLPEIETDIMLNLGNPDNAFNCYNLPSQGVGLARLEFIINNVIGVHPNAILSIDDMPDDIRNIILAKSKGYSSPKDFYQRKLIEGIATIASVFYPRPVIVRMSDFKSNEYANLIGGEQFEPNEENPMLGFRGTARYLSEDFKECFAMECLAIKYLREEMGLTNIKVMIPFVRTLEQADAVINLLGEFGIKSGVAGMEIIMMCEVPSNVILADEFLDYFDGFSIGSNDLTQLSLGLDRDSSRIAHLFDERNLAVKKMLSMAISACLKRNKYIGICGQAPSDYIDLAKWLMSEGIQTMSLNPDSVVNTIIELAN